MNKRAISTRVCLMVFLMLGFTISGEEFRRLAIPLETTQSNFIISNVALASADSGHKPQRSRSERRSVKNGAKKVGHSIKSGVKETGHAVKGGVKSVGRSIKRGGKSVGHSVKRGAKGVGHFFRDIFK